MNTITIEAPVTIDTIVAPLPMTTEQEDALLLLAAASEKVTRVKGGNVRLAPTARAWQFSGNVD